MTQVKTRKSRVNFTVEQKLDCVKLMVNEGYTNKQIIEISGAGPTVVARWKKQYLAGLNGQPPRNGEAMLVNNTTFKSCVIYLITLVVVITTNLKINRWTAIQNPLLSQ